MNTKDLIYEINPYIGVGKMLFGLERHKLRELLNANYKTYTTFPEPISVKGIDIIVPASKNSHDTFDDLEIQTFYDEKNIFSGVRIFPPAKAILKGVDLLKTPYNQLIDWLGKEDKELEKYEEGFTSNKFGVDFYIPEIFDRNLDLKTFKGYCECVTVFRKGRFEE
jgi:hypothetical protein